jgi:hypothetical protein
MKPIVKRKRRFVYVLAAVLGALAPVLLVLVPACRLAPGMTPDSAALPPSCTSWPCGAYKNTDMDAGPGSPARRSIKLSFYGHNSGSIAVGVKEDRDAGTEGWTQYGPCYIEDPQAGLATMVCYPPGYDGPSEAEKDGGLYKCKGGPKCANLSPIVTANLVLPVDPTYVSGIECVGDNRSHCCSNPRKRDSCPPSDGGPPQPTRLTVNVLGVVLGKSGVGRSCQGCYDLVSGESFTVDYWCFDPACC